MFRVRRDFFIYFFSFFSSNAHGVLQVLGHLASFTSLLVYVRMYIYVYVRISIYQVLLTAVTYHCCNLPGFECCVSGTTNL